MITTALIFAIAFSLICVILIVSLFLLYLSGKANSTDGAFLYIAIFGTILLCALLYSIHFDEVQNVNQPNTQQELQQDDTDNK